MPVEPTVYIVDDEADFLASLSTTVSAMGYKTQCFSSPEEYLRQFDAAASGCLILDVRMPRMSGLALQKKLASVPLSPPVIMITAFPEVPTAIRAMACGAVDFLEKSAGESTLGDAIERALKQDAANRVCFARRQAVEARFVQLSPAERQVLQCVLQGDANKRIASTLGVSRRTVEDRRSRVMQKLEVTTMADLVRLAMEAGVPG